MIIRPQLRPVITTERKSEAEFNGEAEKVVSGEFGENATRVTSRVRGEIIGTQNV
jgi:hypothetical protein